MATLSKDTPRVFKGPCTVNELPIIANDIIYAGAAVGESTTAGTMRPLVGADTFWGFALEKCDNTGGAASAKRVKIYDDGIVELAVTGASADTDNGVAVYASDDNTFTLTSSTAHTQIGKVNRYSGKGGTTVCEVYFQGAAKRSI